MRIFRPYQPNGTVHVAPGHLIDTSNWRDENGKAIVFTVVFRNGSASVDSQLGNWMIKEGHAQRTPLILPSPGRILGLA
jgi:hypothetical protein